MRKGLSLGVVIPLVVLTICISVFATVLCMVLGGWRLPHGVSDDLSVSDKVAEIEEILDAYFVEEFDKTELGDAAADAIIEATGDEWSYYVPASEQAEFEETSSNSYCGVGITIQDVNLDTGYLITNVIENAPAWNSGIRTGDILQKADGKNVIALGFDATKDTVRGEEGTTAELTILREESSFVVEVVRKKVETIVASSKMLDDEIGYLSISNFDDNCAKQTIAEIEKLMDKNAKGIIIDVRFNPGGHKSELVEILDYILPEGPVFQDTDYAGDSSTEMSDSSCIDIPIAVLVNQYSFSAAEYLAAALQEYDWAVIVGEKTVGKGRYQCPIYLSDGSIVSLSIGNYYTPQGKSLQSVGVTPDITVAISQEEAGNVYIKSLSDSEDLQLQTARKVLLEQTAAEKS